MAQKLQQLQDLRGIAILLVVMYHASLIFGYTQFKHGGMGVSLFFTISGFVIAYVHAKDRGADAAILFAKKRVARIYAPYLLPFVAILVLFWLTNTGSDYHRDPTNIAKNFLLVQKPSQSIHPYAWSLVYEIFYYITFCVGVILLRLPILIYSTILSIPPIFHIAHQTDVDALYLSSNNLYFVFGAIAGHYYNLVRLRIPKIMVAISGLAFIICPYLTNSNVLRLLFTATFFICYLRSQTSSKIVNRIGAASYSIYLTHALVVPTAKHILPAAYAPISFAVVVAACLGFGLIYHHVIEIRSVEKFGQFLAQPKSRKKLFFKSPDQRTPCGKREE